MADSMTGIQWVGVAVLLSPLVLGLLWEIAQGIGQYGARVLIPVAWLAAGLALLVFGG